MRERPGVFEGAQFAQEDAEDEAALTVLWEAMNQGLLTEAEAVKVAACAPYHLIIDSKHFL